MANQRRSEIYAKSPDFYLSPPFENFDGHRDPEFHTDQSDNGLHKRCEANFYIFCNFENMGL